MQPSELPISNVKSTKQTMRNTSSQKPLSQDSSFLSVNYQEVKTLMKKKQIQYQNQLLLEEAERVHHLISEVQEKERLSRLEIEQNKKKRLMRQVIRYNKITIQSFQQEWNQTFSKTIEDLKELEQFLQNQHDQELKKAMKDMQNAKEGKDLQKIKFSPGVLEMQDQLRRLIKSQRYEEAYVVRSRLQKARKTEMKRFISQSVDHSRKSLQKLKKKHSKDRDLIGERLTTLYLKQKSRYQKEHEQLTKNMRTYQIDLTKIESKIRRTGRKTEQQSKGRSESLGDSLIAGPKIDYKFDVEFLEKKPELTLEKDVIGVDETI